MENFKFSLKETSAQNTDKIDAILQVPNKKKSNFLNIPPLTLEAYSSYMFLLEFSNFIGEEGTATIEIVTSDKEGTMVTIKQNQPFVFKTWEQYSF